MLHAHAHEHVTCTRACNAQIYLILHLMDWAAAAVKPLVTKPGLGPDVLATIRAERLCHLGRREAPRC